jgi:hypothetical protein
MDDARIRLKEHLRLPVWRDAEPFLRLGPREQVVGGAACLQRLL